MRHGSGQRFGMHVVRSAAVKTAATIVFIAAAVCLVARHGDKAISTLIEQEAYLRTLQRDAPFQLASLAIVAFALASFIPGTNGKSLIVGWLFGAFVGALVINVASTVSAFLMFALARRLLREFFYSKYTERLHFVNRGIDRNGGRYLVVLRLIPVAPFSVINTLMGVSSIRWQTFWWSTQLGMLPSNFAFAWLGASLPDIGDIQQQGLSEFFSWQLFAAIATLGLIPLVARKLLATRAA